MGSLLDDWRGKSIYTMTYMATNDKEGIKDILIEKVLAYDAKDAEQIIKDRYENTDTKIEFSEYNPIKIEDFELFIIDKLDEAHIIRAGSSYKND